jgi:hypothetical protein
MHAVRSGLEDTEAAAPGSAQVLDVLFTRVVTEWALPTRVRPCCGKITMADPSAGTPGQRYLRAGAERGSAAAGRIRERARGNGPRT